MTITTRRRSRFVTVLGWFCCVMGGLGVPARLLALGDLGQVLAQPGAQKSTLEAFGGSGMHAITRFELEHLGLMAGLQLLQALLMLAVGVGLVRRESWALPAGGVLVALGALRQTSSLIVEASSQPMQAPGMSLAQAKEFAPILVAVYLVSLAWLGFLVWKFRQPHIRQEFLE